MLADGEKILFLRSVPFTYTIADTTSTIVVAGEEAGTRSLFYAVVIAGHALASMNPGGGGGLTPADLGAVDLADEGTRWVRGWDNEARDALLAANKLRESDAAE